MRPFHEQALTVRFNGGNTAVVDESGRTIAVSVSKEAQAALLAHGDVVRALLGELDPDGHVIACRNGGENPDDCSPRCRKVTTALRKAGVLGGGES